MIQVTFLDLKSRNHFVLIPRDRLNELMAYFFLIEKNKNRFVFPSYGLKWILKNLETLIG